MRKIVFDRGTVASSCNRKKERAHVVVIVMIMSKLAPRENTMMPKLVAATSALQKPKPLIPSVELVRSICRPTHQTAAIVSNPERADPKRADHSFIPNALNAAIIIQ